MNTQMKPYKALNAKITFSVATYSNGTFYECEIVTSDLRSYKANGKSEAEALRNAMLEIGAPNTRPDYTPHYYRGATA